jgi:hypothetical protein
MLGNAQMRWLALLLTIERVFRMFFCLKNRFFQSQDKCPLFLLNLCENPLSEIWLYFLDSMAYLSVKEWKR